MWYTGRKEEAVTRQLMLCDAVDIVSQCQTIPDSSLRVNCWLDLGEWRLSQSSPGLVLSESLQVETLLAFKRATLMQDCGYRAWHAWALLNFRIAGQIGEKEETRRLHDSREFVSQTGTELRSHVVTSIKGFVQAINLGTKRQSASVQQDLLNILTCLFKYGNLPDVASTLSASISTVAIEAWLGVLPQLLARIHIREPSVRAVLHTLLSRLGEKHPQALMYPLAVLLKGPVQERKIAAESLMDSLKAHSSELVTDALMVSTELIRVAILWLETWHEGLEDASRLYFGENNVAAMLELLLPLHEKLEKGAETITENEFLSHFGQDLSQAHRYILEYIRLNNEASESASRAAGRYDTSRGLSRHNEEAETAMNKAWDIYYKVFRKINKQIPSLTKLELSSCSPALSKARSLELGVPGSYRVDGSFVRIEKFIPSVQVITSKQRPRKITLRGGDGKDYIYLLKGHEDLRQDERVMQLFGLVNALLVRDPQTKNHDLRIQRYTITPLSQNAGVVG
jgi:serine/threonine-protein kinase mTOR